LSGSQPEPTFIATGQAHARLGIVRSQLQNLFPHLLYLYVTKRETRLFSAAYIDAYATYLRERSQQATIATARAFARTAQAQDIVTEVTTRVDTILREKIIFTPQEVMQLLNVAKMTITSWHQGNVFTVRRQKVTPKRNRGKEQREILLIPAKELRAALEWHKPQQ
jgi:hypothetical protein